MVIRREKSGVLKKRKKLKQRRKGEVVMKKIRKETWRKIEKKLFQSV